MPDQTPSVGRIVHYTSFGTPGGEYTSQCRAAIITDVKLPDYGNSYSGHVSLAVLNPSGMFFNEAEQNEGPPHHGGTWHWPEKV